MIHIDKKSNCCGCQACAQICPRSCITMQTDEEGFWYPVVDTEVCIHCGMCERACPVMHSTEGKQALPTAYAAYVTDEHIRIESSSGGIFSLLAEYTLNNNGVVYGAVLENGRVKHIRAADNKSVLRMRGSKYVQSDVGLTYREARQDLDNGKSVLFTGTPCQIEGLHTFLSKEYPGLLCMDIICHGVPSPLVWDQYVSYREEMAGASTDRISFRNKQYGWKNFSVCFMFGNNQVYLAKHRDDLFMQAFLHDLCLRPSCYHCRFKKIDRASDITVADFWGAEHVCPEMDDDKGLSLVMVHSQKGGDVLSDICGKLRFREVSLLEAIKYNKSAVRSAAEPNARSGFMRDAGREPFDKLISAYVRRSGKMRQRIERILQKRQTLERIIPSEAICRIEKRKFSNTCYKYLHRHRRFCSKNLNGEII